MTDPANVHAHVERQWWDEHTDPQFVWGEEGDGVDACLRLVLHGLGPLLDPGERGTIVDLGCGPARLLAPLARLLPERRLVGVDVAPGMARLAAERCAADGNVEVLVGDGRTIPVPTGAAAAAYSVLVFQHLPPLAQLGYVAEAGRVLAHDGRFVVQVLPGDWQAEQAGSFLNHPIGLGSLVQAGRDAGLELVEQVNGAVLAEWAWLVFERR